MPIFRPPFYRQKNCKTNHCSTKSVLWNPPPTKKNPVWIGILPSSIFLIGIVLIIFSTTVNLEWWPWVSRWWWTSCKYCVIHFQHYSKSRVMTMAIPVVVNFLSSDNKELSRNVSSYLSLAALDNADLLAKHMEIILNSIFRGLLYKHIQKQNIMYIKFYSVFPWI